MKHIFVLAMDDRQRAELETICDSNTAIFHNVMDVDSLVHPDDINFNELLEQVRSVIAVAGVPVDAIIAQWDFPTSVLVPILCKEFGVPSPSLESVLKCEHKYWSRLEQTAVIPDVVPRFCAVDPFSEMALTEIDIDFPFWIKPVKAFSSQLGFLINNETEFYRALEQIRPGIGRIGSAFDEVLARVTLPPAVKLVGGSSCIAEEVVQGRQIAPEGYVLNGKVKVHGIFDMHRVANGTMLDRYEYPSSAPDYIQYAVVSKCEEFLGQIGFDNGCFNAEFMWDDEQNLLRLIEFNTRISQSHSEMFLQVDGRSNHEVAVAVALGEEPQMPVREGPYNVAAKCMISHQQDGVVGHIPTDDELKALQEKYPHMQLKLDIQPGTRLRDLPNQDSYRYVLGEIYLGARSKEKLIERYNDCVSSLNIQILPLEEEAEPGESEPDALGPDSSGKGNSGKGASNEHNRHLSASSKGDGERLHTDA